MKIKVLDSELGHDVGTVIDVDGWVANHHIKTGKAERFSDAVIVDNSTKKPVTSKTSKSK